MTTPLTLDLAIDGMTCASCVGRVEKRLNRVPGAVATVNLALESAHVEITQPDDGDPLTASDLVEAVRKAGYDARVTHSDLSVAEAPATAAAGSATSSTAAVGAPTGSSTAVLTDPATQRDPNADNASAANRAAPSGVVEADTSAPAPDRGADLLRRLQVSAIIAIPVVALSMVPSLQFNGWQWIVAVLSLPVVTWGAWPFHRAAARAGRHGASTMDTLVSIGVTAATLWSVWALLLGGAGALTMRMTPTLIPAFGDHTGTPELYFEVAVVVTTFLLAGRYAEHRSRRRAGDALRSLLELGANSATLRVTKPDGSTSEQEIPADQLAVDDVFVVRPGEKIATDGVVVEGSGAIDTSLLTGEPMPVDVSAGDDVTGATINTSGHLVVRATRVGQETTLAQIGRLVSQAQTGKAPIQRLADRISAVFVPIVFVIAVLTLITWLLVGGTDSGNVQAAFTASVAVLIIACPCALGLATPTALLVGTGRAAQLGIVIKGPEILESTRRIDTVVLDKTGTVTEGAMSVSDVIPLVDGVTRAEALRLAGALEAKSEHPIARAITAAAEQDAADASDSPSDAPVEVGADGVIIGSTQALDFTMAAGGGVSGQVRTAHSGPHISHRVLVGKPKWVLAELALESTADTDGAAQRFSDAVDGAEKLGATAVVVAWNGTPQAVITLSDPIKRTSQHAINNLMKLGLRPYLLTGDNAGAAREVGHAVGIPAENVIAEVLPADKVDVVRRLQDEGAVVAMVGDGVNDAAALAQAGRRGLGLAMGTGTDVAIEASDITLISGDLRSAATAIRISRRTLRIIKQNLFWAFIYNVAAIPLAALGLLNPMIAGAAMAMSSVLVVTNSLRLRRAG